MIALGFPFVVKPPAKPKPPIIRCDDCQGIVPAETAPAAQHSQQRIFSIEQIQHQPELCLDEPTAVTKFGTDSSGKSLKFYSCDDGQAPLWVLIRDVRTGTLRIARIIESAEEFKIFGRTALNDFFKGFTYYQYPCPTTQNPNQFVYRRYRETIGDVCAIECTKVTACASDFNVWLGSAYGQELTAIFKAAR